MTSKASPAQFPTKRETGLEYKLEFSETPDAPSAARSPGRSRAELVSCVQTPTPWDNRFTIARERWSPEGWGGRGLKTDSQGLQCRARLCVGSSPGPLTTLPRGPESHSRPPPACRRSPLRLCMGSGRVAMAFYHLRGVETKPGRGQLSSCLHRKWLGCLGTKRCYIPDLGAQWNLAWALPFPLGLQV